MAKDEFIDFDEEEFDLAALTSWEAKHSDFVDKTLMMHQVHPITTSYGNALIVLATIVEDEKSFNVPPVSVLIGAQAMVEVISQLKDPYLMAFTIGSSIAEKSERQYYHFVPTPEKIKEIIRKYRQSNKRIEG